MQVLLTGAGGWLGQALAARLVQEPGVRLTTAGRRPLALPGRAKALVVGEFNQQTDWRAAVAGQQLVIHVAGLTAAGAAGLPQPANAFAQVNVQATLALAQQAQAAGVQRLIFISSIGVLGNCSEQPLTELATPNPQGLYAQSKWAAEQGLWQLQAGGGLELTVIRPPLVYGAGAKGAFGRLVHWVKQGRPLPLASVRNQRTLVGLDNLVDLIVTCCTHPAAANQVFLAGDAESVSTPELIQRLAQAGQFKVPLLPVPELLLRLGASCLGQSDKVQGLLGSLPVDISKARDRLGWQPPFTVDEGLKRCF